MNKQGILVVSFGTTHIEAEEKSILAVEKKIACRYQEAFIYRAYTSGMIRKILAKRATPVLAIDEALAQMEKDGVTDVFVQPTHLIYGEEYEKIVCAVEENKGKFTHISMGLPLLGDVKDMKEVAHILQEEYPLQSSEGLVLMGHGTKHYCNTVYAAMEYVCQEQGFENMFVGTVEAYPELDIVIRKLKEAKIKKVILLPFMLVAGDHAKNDMAGEDTSSWKSRFQQEGFDVQIELKGLGEYTKIQEMYCDKVSFH